MENIYQSLTQKLKQTYLLNNVHATLSTELEIERSCTEGHHMEINKSFISELNNAIKSLKMKSTGSDMIHNILFKHIPTRIHSDLLKMTNKSWETSQVPPVVWGFRIQPTFALVRVVRGH